MSEDGEIHVLIALVDSMLRLHCVKRGLIDIDI